MQRDAIDQARLRLDKAWSALAALECGNTLTAVEKAWSDYLIAVAGIYSKLEQGCKGFGKSEAWFGRKKNERKVESLLEYLHQARNADEHGIAHGVDAVETIHVIFIKNGEVWEKLSTAYVSSVDAEESRLNNDAAVEVRDKDGVIIESHTVITHAVQLLKVKNRGRIYVAPEIFMGRQIIDKSPLGVARLSIPFFVQLIDDAASLMMHPALSSDGRS